MIPVLIIILLIGLCAVAVLNAFTFPRLKDAPPAFSQPAVSVLIPARDEAAGIADTLAGLLAQTPAPDEILILDDASTDGTAEAAQRAAGNNPIVRVIPGLPLPSGWLGKNWACHQLSQAARGQTLLFTDADVRWQPGALAALLDEFQRTQADLLTIWPTQITHTWPERLVVPLMALTIVGYLPVLATHHLPGRAFAAAMGQCLLFRRTAYDHIGGHAAVRGKIVEDMAFAHTLKGAGLRLRVADGAGMIATRMYHNWAQVRAGFAKNILAGHGGYLALALSTIFHWGVFLLPWGWLLLGAWLPSREAWPLWPLTLCALGVGLRALTAAVTRQRVADSLLLPVSVLLMTIIAAQSALWQGRGGPQWKGRQVTK